MSTPQTPLPGTQVNIKKAIGTTFLGGHWQLAITQGGPLAGPDSFSAVISRGMPGK